MCPISIYTAVYAFVYSSTFYVNRLKSVILGEDPAVDDVVEFDEGLTILYKIVSFSVGSIDLLFTIKVKFLF